MSMDHTFFSDSTSHSCSSKKCANSSSGNAADRSDKHDVNLTSVSFAAQSPEAMFSTPKPALHLTSNNVSEESDFSIINPFENHSTLGSLHQPSFSPSVFGNSTKSCTESSSKSPSSFWSIDQIAILKPVDIDLSTLHEQQNYARLDGASEMKAQRAIDEFFANHGSLHSPWSSSDNHYLAIISPSPTCLKKKRATPSSLAGIHQTPCSKLSDVAEMREEDPYRPSCANDGLDDARRRSVATQTVLTIPCNADTTAMLKKYYVYEEGRSSQDNLCVSLGSSGLRRKLLFPESEAPDAVDSASSEAAGDKVSSTPKKSAAAGMDHGEDPDEHQGHHEKDEMLFFTSPVSGGRMFDLGTPSHKHPAVLREPLLRLRCSPPASPICSKLDGHDSEAQPSVLTASADFGQVTPVMAPRSSGSDPSWTIDNCESTPVALLNFLRPGSCTICATSKPPRRQEAPELSFYVL